jgi:hypothetical protein
MPIKFINEIENIFLSNLTPEPFYAPIIQKLNAFVGKVIGKEKIN